MSRGLLIGLIAGVSLIGVAGIVFLIVRFTGGAGILPDALVEEIVDDGSPVIITDPTFYRDADNRPILKVKYNVKRPDEVRSVYMFTLRCHGETDVGLAQASVNMPRLFMGHELEGRGTLELPFAFWLGDIGSLPPCAVYITRGTEDGPRLSNKLRVRLPTDVASLPLDPDLAAVKENNQNFRVQIASARWVKQFATPEYLEVTLQPSVGKPDPNGHYRLVCYSKVLAGGFAEDEKLTADQLVQGGTIRMGANFGPARGSQQVYVEAYDPDRPEVVTTVSNMLTVSGQP